MREKILRIFVLLIVLPLLLFCELNPSTAFYPNEGEKITILVKSSPSAELYSILELYSKELLDELVKAPGMLNSNPPPITDVSISFEHLGEKRHFLVDQQGVLYTPENKEKYILTPSKTEQLMRGITLLRSTHYGEMTPWDEIKKILPNKSKFEVIDLETGIRFQVQRRAGRKHADVQPITKEDTQKMKAIYEGNWSWKRRAILVKIKDHLFAASMHGMPHGAGAIKDNDFPGHFCIHFHLSTTHTAKEMDPEHRFMILKAAGKLHQYIETSSHDQLIDLYLYGLAYQEYELLKLILTESSWPSHEQIKDQLEKVTSIKKLRVPEDIDITNLLLVKIPVEISIAQGKKQIRKNISLILRRNNLFDRWMIEIDAKELLIK